MFDQLLEKIALGLDTCRIPYMLIGGQAVLLYGEPRLTRNIDITLGFGPERAQAIVELVITWGWQVLVDSPKEFVQRTMVMPCLDPISDIRIDFIFSTSVYEHQAMQRVRRVAIGKTQVCFASVEDLIIHKTIAGRPRDLEDVRGILLKTPAIDLAYVRHWLSEFDRSLSESFLQRFEDLWNLTQRLQGGSP
jgi:hypothetical protein